MRVDAIEKLEVAVSGDCSDSCCCNALHSDSKAGKNFTAAEDEDNANKSHKHGNKGGDELDDHYNRRDYSDFGKPKFRIS